MKNQLRGWLTAVIVALVAANTVAPVVLGLPKDDPIIDDDPDDTPRLPLGILIGIARGPPRRSHSMLERSLERSSS